MQSDNPSRDEKEMTARENFALDLIFAPLEGTSPAPATPAKDAPNQGRCALPGRKVHLVHLVHLSTGVRRFSDFPRPHRSNRESLSSRVGPQLPKLQMTSAPSPEFPTASDWLLFSALLAVSRRTTATHWLSLGLAETIGERPGHTSHHIPPPVNYPPAHENGNTHVASGVPHSRA